MQDIKKLNIDFAKGQSQMSKELMQYSTKDNNSDDKIDAFRYSLLNKEVLSLNKEEIEESKECLNNIIENTYAEGKAIKLDNLRKYIEQLENKLKEKEEKEKAFIDKLKRRIKEHTFKTEKDIEAQICTEILNQIEGEKNGI